MGKVAGRRKNRKSSRTKLHGDPIRGVNVEGQKVELIVRKVHPSQMTPPKRHIFSPIPRAVSATREEEAS